MVKKPPSASKSGAKPPSRRAATATASAKSPKPAPEADETGPEHLLSPEELRAQQTLLNIFCDAFAPVLQSESFAQKLQDVKQALYNRDFGAAFRREDFLEVYAARWSPTRALCYARVLRGMGEHLAALLAGPDGGMAGGSGDAADGAGLTGEQQRRADQIRSAEEVPDDGVEEPALRVLAIGGGAAETVAFGSYLSSSPTARGQIHLLDTGPWAGIAQRLSAHLTTAPPISKYASAAAKAANAALLSPADRLRVAFSREDVLALDDAALARLLCPGPLLVTLLFTLNELYTGAGVAATTAFLRRLSAAVPAGSLLLVVDSPGSYSEAAVGPGGDREKKRYPMQWLLDHTLLQEPRSGRKGQPQRQGEVPAANDDGDGDGDDKADADAVRTDCVAWEKLESADSVWFRLADGLRYPIQLENMRYQMHLYRACPRIDDRT
ncbi:hypothetical protein DL766_007758 [Monosporascus sp. MC13-8B]|uniref:25S rRNA (Uridine(2843)-N(3))-methyltransferase n=1 Tax=Monosporascus cannonballus TaxID=155416 RepID=A0ABY0HI77_9PEZI|nr:hypothetical protein DL762_000778 [Monosporascus cannonballus]RYO96403.1 hypothetical protein DL763_003259 [Monosporascus cannonballus]RYP22228.1 hypothetical protein DL766_007758 [Monosporascus sp. MC13-8B]